MADTTKCDFCGKDIDNKNERVINGEFYEDIVDGFAEGRRDLPDITICKDCFEDSILKKLSNK